MICFETFLCVSFGWNTVYSQRIDWCNSLWDDILQSKGTDTNINDLWAGKLEKQKRLNMT